MLLLKSSDGGGGGPGDVVDGMLVDEDEDDDCSPDVVSPTSASTPSRGIRNFFRKRHKSVTIGFVYTVSKSFDCTPISVNSDKRAICP